MLLTCTCDSDLLGTKCKCIALSGRKLFAVFQVVCTTSYYFCYVVSFWPSSQCSCVCCVIECKCQRLSNKRIESVLQQEANLYSIKKLESGSDFHCFSKSFLCNYLSLFTPVTASNHFRGCVSLRDTSKPNIFPKTQSQDSFPPISPIIILLSTGVVSQRPGYCLTFAAWESKWQVWNRITSQLK